MARKYLSARERAALLEAQGNVCANCKRPAPRYIGEHTTPVALGNEDKPDALWCEPCAKRKTFGDDGTRGDISAIAKVKRLAEGRTQYDRRRKFGATMQSRGFRKRGE